MPFDTDTLEGFAVVGFRPTRAPNPNCCTNPTVLCRDCATLALTTNVANNLVVNADEHLAPFGTHPAEYLDENGEPLPQATTTNSSKGPEDNLEPFGEPSEYLSNDDLESVSEDNDSDEDNFADF